MFNDDQDDDAPVDIDTEPDADLVEADMTEEEPEAPQARGPVRRRAKKPAKAKKAAKAPKAPPAKATAKAQKKPKASKKAARAAKKKAGKASAKPATPPGDLTGVKAGLHTLWVSKELAGALTSKDRRKLKALLKRAEKRRKSKTK
jgi:hypothetical protein